MSWRVINLVLLAAAVVAVPLSHSALSQKNGGPKGPAPKVQICHFPDESTEGHVIEVSQNAVAAHLAKHGDCTAFEVAEGTRDCRCLTCDEQCQAAAESCRAACDPDDTECLDACAAALTECLAACETAGG
jgi:hypothetical protein